MSGSETERGAPRPDWRAVAGEIAAAYAAMPGVRAVALGGSRAGTRADDASDIDLYVYGDGAIDRERREALILPRAARAEIDNRYWEQGDEWVERGSGIAVDVILRDAGWIEAELARVLDRHEASIGYTTAIWHNVRHSLPLADRDGWLAGLKASADRPYPDALARAIVARNRPLLDRTLSSFAAQIGKALGRGDAVAGNHRTAAFLASYFDILFAINRRTHPGEKRLLDQAEALALRPAGMREDVGRLVAGAFPGGDHQGLLRRLAEGLDPLIAGSLPRTAG